MKKLLCALVLAATACAHHGGGAWPSSPAVVAPDSTAEGGFLRPGVETGTALLAVRPAEYADVFLFGVDTDYAVYAPHPETSVFAFAGFAWRNSTTLRLNLRRAELHPIADMWAETMRQRALRGWQGNGRKSITDWIEENQP